MAGTCIVTHPAIFFETDMFTGKYAGNFKFGKFKFFNFT